jgi:hypothetical protein
MGDLERHPLFLIFRDKRNMLFVRMGRLIIFKTKKKAKNGNRRGTREKDGR